MPKNIDSPVFSQDELDAITFKQNSDLRKIHCSLSYFIDIDAELLKAI